MVFFESLMIFWFWEMLVVRLDLSLLWGDGIGLFDLWEDKKIWDLVQFDKGVE